MKSITLLRLFGILVISVFSGENLGAEGHWARFRGPDGSGVVADQNVPDSFDAKTLAWSVPLPGPGSSSPVLWGDAVFSTGEDKAKGEVRLVCLDAKTGEQRWSKALPTGKYRTHSMNNAAASTPCLAADLVVVSWYDSKKKLAMLSAFSHGGEKRWDYEVGSFKGSHGLNLQPVIEDGRVVVAHLHQGGGYVAALDGNNGKPLWKTDYPEKGKKTPYVPTPVSDGGTLYVLEDGGNLSAVDPLSGEVRWQERLMANFYTSPLLIGGKLYCLSREGELFVAEVGKKFTLLSTSDLKPGENVKWVDATPAVAHDSLYVRIGARLDCYREK